MIGRNSIVKHLWTDRNSKRNLFLGEFLFLAGSFCGFVQYFCLASLINKLNSGIDVFAIGLGFFSIVLSAGLIYFGKLFLIKVVTDFEYGNRNLLVRRLTYLEMLQNDNQLKLFFDVVTRGIFNLSNKVQWLVEKWPLIFIEGCIAIIFAILVDWRLAFTYSSCVVVIQIVSSIIGKYYLKRIDCYRKTLASYEFNIDEVIENREHILGEGYAEVLKRKNIVEMRNLLIEKWKIEILGQIYEMLKNYSTLLYMIVYYILGGWLICTGEVSIGILISFNIYSDAIKTLFSSLVTYQETNIDCNIEFRNFCKVIEKEGVKEEEKYGQAKGDLIVNSISYMSENKVILKDVSLDIKEGEKICIVGSNGAGKSTLGKILAGIYKETGGNILVISDDACRERKKGDVQYIDQNTYFLYETVMKNMQYASVLEERENKHTINEIMEKKGLKRVVDGKIITDFERVLEEGERSVSGGEAKALGILRGLLARKKIIVFDEPTEGLDKNKVEAFCDFIENLEETSIVITHDLRVCRNADRIILMENGVVTEKGTHSELIENSKSYYDLICEEEHHG